MKYPFENYILIGSSKVGEKIKIYCSATNTLSLNEGDEIIVSGTYTEFESNRIKLKNCSISK